MNFINSIKELKRIQETEISPSKDIDSNNLLLKDLDNIDFNKLKSTSNKELIIENELIKTESEINKASTNGGLLSQLENIILPSQEESVKPLQMQDMLVINEENSKNNCSDSPQFSVPCIKIATNVNLKPSKSQKFGDRRDSDQELANILANVVFKDAGKNNDKSPTKEQSISELMKDVDKIIEDTKEVSPPNPKANFKPPNAAPINKQCTFLQRILKFNAEGVAKEVNKELQSTSNREHNGDNLRFSESPIGSRRGSKSSAIDKQKLKDDDKQSCTKSPTSKQNKEDTKTKNNEDYLQKLLKGSEIV